jgi:hypothetical protein
MKPPMRQVATKYNYTRNAYGDFTVSTTETLPCHFRYITNQISDTNNEVVQSDAMAWFEPDSGVVNKDIIQIDNTFFRVEKVTRARRLRDPEVQFIKVDLQRYGVIS